MADADWPTPWYDDPWQVAIALLSETAGERL
jgi:hypothetical protein